MADNSFCVWGGGGVGGTGGVHGWCDKSFGIQTACVLLLWVGV